MELISQSLKESLHQQFLHEKTNASIYLFICGYLRNKGLDKLADKFKSQYDEENEHALQIFDLLTDLNTYVSIGEIERGDFVINTPMDIAQMYLTREIDTTESLMSIKDLAMDEHNCVVEEFIRKMITQQQHEYSEATTFMDKVELFGNDWKFVALWDSSLG